MFKKMMPFISGVLVSAMLFTTPAYAIDDESSIIGGDDFVGSFVSDSSESIIDPSTYEEPPIEEVEEAPLVSDVVEDDTYMSYEVRRLVSSYNIGAEKQDMIVAALSQTADPNTETSDAEKARAFKKFQEWSGEKASGDDDALFINYCAETCGLIDDHIFPGINNTAEYIDYFFAHEDDGWFAVYGADDCTQFGGSGYEVSGGEIAIMKGYDDSVKIGLVTLAESGQLYVAYSKTPGEIVLEPLKNDSGEIQIRQVVRITYPTVQSRIFWFIQDEIGLNSAAACGILANMRCESGFRTEALGDSGSSYGLCQWHNGRWERLKAFCDSNGYDWEMLNGQLNYLKYELENHYTYVYETLKRVPNTSQGAYDAAYEFCVNFERPAGGAESGEKRGNEAQTVFWPQFGQ